MAKSSGFARMEDGEFVERNPVDGMLHADQQTPQQVRQFLGQHLQRQRGHGARCVCTDTFPLYARYAACGRVSPCGAQFGHGCRLVYAGRMSRSRSNAEVHVAGAQQRFVDAAEM